MTVIEMKTRDFSPCVSTEDTAADDSYFPPLLRSIYANRPSSSVHVPALPFVMRVPAVAGGSQSKCESTSESE